MSDDCGPDMCCADDGVCDAGDYGGGGGGDWADGGDDNYTTSTRRAPTIDEQRKKCETLRRDIERMEKESELLLELFTKAKDNCTKEKRDTFLVVFRRTEAELLLKKQQEVRLMQTVVKMEEDARRDKFLGVVMFLFFIFIFWPHAFGVFRFIFTGRFN